MIDALRTAAAISRAAGPINLIVFNAIDKNIIRR